MEYNGSASAFVEVKEKRNNTVIYNGNLNPGDQFTFAGSGNGYKMGNIIYFFVDEAKNTSMHTSCSVNIYKGDIYGDFTVIEVSNDDLHLCDGDANNCGCEGGFRYLALRYDGASIANIVVKKKSIIPYILIALMPM